MAKLKKPSKRQPARQRYKILKKIRDHNKKARKEAKKHPRKNKQTVIQVPNICPFKESIIKEVEEMKRQKEEERQRQREAAKVERQNIKQGTRKPVVTGGLENLVASAELRGNIHENFTLPTSEKFQETKHEHSLKSYYKEFKKVVEAADVILEVVDARDPLGTRCTQVEQVVRNLAGSKRLVVILNKADLVPRTILDQWLKYLKKSIPAIAFKASTQDQSRKLGQKKFTKAEKTTQGSSSVGAEVLMSLLANYCRNKGIKTSITVGVVGLPNVGKSSIINSLKRSRACNVGATPGVTKAMQIVQLDSKIKLLDSPGIVFAAGSDTSASLRNAVRVTSLTDPVTPANAILQRVTKQQMMEMYDITEYNTFDEFYSLKAARMGRFRKGGLPDSKAAARGLLEDWNNGKIKYYTVPPEDEDQVHISSTIVTEFIKEFDLDAIETMEVDTLNKIEHESGSNKDSFLLESLGPCTNMEKMEEDTPTEENLLSKQITIDTGKKAQKRVDNKTLKIDPEMQLEGNLKLNQIKKNQFKKEKKMRNRREKVAQQLAAGLDQFSLASESKDADYNFDEDYVM